MKKHVETRLCLHANISLTQWEQAQRDQCRDLSPVKSYLNLPCVTVVNDRTIISRTKLGTSLSVSTSIGTELKLKQQEV